MTGYVNAINAEVFSLLETQAPEYRNVWEQIRTHLMNSPVETLGTAFKTVKLDPAETSTVMRIFLTSLLDIQCFDVVTTILEQTDSLQKEDEQTIFNAAKACNAKEVTMAIMLKCIARDCIESDGEEEEAGAKFRLLIKDIKKANSGMKLQRYQIEEIAQWVIDTPPDLSAKLKPIYLHPTPKSIGYFKKVKKAYWVNSDTKEIFPIADMNIKNTGLLGKLDSIKAVSEHSNVQGFLSIEPYTCKHGKSKLRAFQPYFAHCLVDLLAWGARLPLILQKACVEQVASGLDFIHTEGFVHRDIKPDNILVNPLPESEGFHFVIADLDEIVRIDPPRQSFSGTKIYWPPIQREKQLPQTQCWDIYAFAITLAKVFQGQYPEITSYLDDVMCRSDLKGEYINPISIRDEIMRILSHSKPVEKARNVNGQVRRLSD
ncbi:MAG: protein kinase [Chlamydiia bacterium]|nr:protein kinase [Chlamydiia bacterium]